MPLVGAGFLFSIIVRVAWAKVQTLRHVKLLASMPRGFLADVMEDYTCWGSDIAEVVIHANHTRDEKRRDIVVATCRAACLSNIGCHAWTLHHGSHGARGSGHCWLKYGCEHKNVDPYSVSGLVDHKHLIQHVQAPDIVDHAHLVGVLDDTNCWGRDLVEVDIKSTGDTTRDELAVACKDACIANRACAAWTLNHGRIGMQGKGHCWLKSSCAGRTHDTRAEAGVVIHNPTTKATTDTNTSTTSTSTTGTTSSTTCTTKATSTTSTASATSTSGTTSSTTMGADSDLGSNAEGGHGKSKPGNGTESNFGKTTNKPTKMRFLGHSEPVAPQAQPSSLRGRDGNIPKLSEKDKGIIGGAVGASTGALALGLLAGLLPATSPQSTGGLVQPSPTFAAVGVDAAEAKSHALAGSNTKTEGVSDTDVVVIAGSANNTTDTNHEEEEEAEGPVTQWWGWVFLIPLFFMATLCCFAFFMFKGNVAGTWSKCQRSRAYSEEGLEASFDTSEDILSGDLPSPRSPVPMCLRSQLMYNSFTPAPRAFLRSPVHPPTHDVSVPRATLQNTQVGHQSPLPMAQAAVTVLVPTSPQRLTSQQQQQMSLAASQQQLQVQDQQSRPSQQTGGSNSLFDAIDQNQDGIITRSEFNRAFGMSPSLVGSASTPVFRAVIERWWVANPGTGRTWCAANHCRGSVTYAPSRSIAGAST